MKTIFLFILNNRHTHIAKLLIDAGAEVTDELLQYICESTSSNSEVIKLLTITLEKKKTDKIK